MDDNLRNILGLPFQTLYSYWQHYWTHCVDMLTDKDNVSFKIEGPRMLLMDLIAELEGHGLSNKENINYFRGRISEFNKSDLAFKKINHSIIDYLLPKLEDKNYTSTCITLCHEAINELQEKQYFFYLVDWLAEVITNSQDNTREVRKKINDISHLIIAEYIAEGFVPEEIIRYESAIPGVALTVDGGIFYAPSEIGGLKESNYESKEAYYKEVLEYLKNRNVKERLEILKTKYYSTPQKALFIVRLNGLKGPIDDYIGDINIYSPKQKRYTTHEDPLSNIEKTSEDKDIVNAAIPIDYISNERAITEAKEKLEEVIDILTLTYKTKTPIEMATNNYAIVSNKEVIASGSSAIGNDPEMASIDIKMRYYNSLDLSEIKDDGFKFLSGKHHILESCQNVLRRRLKSAAHWYTKASIADKDEDKLLYSWFAIEGLLKVNENSTSEILDKTKDTRALKLIQAFASSIICKNYFHSYLIRTYNSFYYYTKNLNNFYDLPEEVINKSGLNLKTGDYFRDEDFINALPDLIDNVNNDIVRDQLSELECFYHDRKGIDDKKSQIEYDILMIYRLRNMIVHNAALSCVNISFYAREAKFIAQSILRYVIDEADENKTIEDIILGATLRYKVFIKNYEEELKRIKGLCS